MGDTAPRPVEHDAHVALADGTTLHYTVATATAAPDGVPVVLLHGLASNRTRWAEFAATTSLTRRCAVLRVDLRGHGASETHERLTLERWCDDLAALLAARGDAQAVCVGHSLGAQVALAFAARHPEHCAAMALIDPVFGAALRGKWRAIAALRPLFSLVAFLVRLANRIGLRRRVVIPYDLQELDRLARKALGSKEAEAEFVRQYSSMRADLQHFRTAHYFEDLVEMFRPVPALASIRMPVLVLLSSGGTFADPAIMARLVSAFPRQQLVRIECQHWPLTEKPAEVRAAIEAWYAALYPAPASSPA